MPQKQPPAKTAVCLPGDEASGASCAAGGTGSLGGRAATGGEERGDQQGKEGTAQSEWMGHGEAPGPRAFLSGSYEMRLVGKRIRVRVFDQCERENSTKCFLDIMGD